MADLCTREGAERLKETIKQYWRERGCSVSVELHQAAFNPAMRSARFDLRSNLINGQPATLARRHAPDVRRPKQAA